MNVKQIQWENEPTIITTIDVSYLNTNAKYYVDDRIVENRRTVLEPMICERCGASINPKTLQCESCGTYYREVMK